MNRERISQIPLAQKLKQSNSVRKQACPLKMDYYYYVHLRSSGILHDCTAWKEETQQFVSSFLVKNQNEGREMPWLFLALEKNTGT